MMILSIRGLLMSIAALVVLAVAAVPAQATVTPVNSAATGTATDAGFTDESNGLRVRCPRSTFTGRTSADGRSVSGTLDFVSSGGVTCTESFFGSSVRVVCRGNVTFRSTSSISGSTVAGTTALDAGFSCTITPIIGSARTIRGSQSPSNCTWIYQQGTLNFRSVCNTIAVDGGGESSMVGTYRIDQRLTIS